MAETSRAAAPGVIEPHVLYRVDELRARLGWRQHAWRTATRNGLRTLHAGGRVYVLGSDLIGYLERQAAGGADE